MLIVHVHIRVNPGDVEDFMQATLENARSSVQEAGVARFDFIRDRDDPTRFLLLEVYRSEQDPAKHKETAHYQQWRDTVAPMMARPRQSFKYTNLFPDDEGWG